MTRELNLLPPQRRLTLKRELLLTAVVRFANSVLLGVSVITVCGLAVGVVLWVMTQAASTTDAEVLLNIRRFSELRSIVGRDNAFLATLHRVDTERVLWSALVRDLLAVVPPGVTVTSLAADAAGKQIVLSGSAPTRSTLIVFEDRLHLLPWVVSVEAPHENLLQRENPAFRFSMVIDATRRERGLGVNNQ